MARKNESLKFEFAIFATATHLIDRFFIFWSVDENRERCAAAFQDAVATAAAAATYVGGARHGVARRGARENEY